MEGAERVAAAVRRRGLQRRDGLTSELFPTERDPNPKCQTDTVPNNITGRTGIMDPNLLLSDIEKFSLFMRFLAPPAPSATVPGERRRSPTDGSFSVTSAVPCVTRPRCRRA